MNVSKQNIANIYPLTPLQEGFLFHTLSNQDDSYIQQLAYLLKGSFNENHFLKVWQVLIDRHEILRTVFLHTGADRSLQVVLKKHQPAWESFDLRGLDENAQQQRRKQLKQRDRRRGFKLDKDSLMRFTLLYLADDLTEVIWSHHHIIMDGWSLGILLSESTALYQNIASELAYTPSFANYVKWLEKKDKQQSLDYWRHYLEDYQTEIKLPYTAAYQATVTEERIRGQFQLPEPLFQAAQQLSKNLKISLNSLLHATWALLLARYNGCEDVVFGTTVSGRSADIDQVENIVGLFINTIPVRVSLAAKLTVKQLLLQIHTRGIDSKAHHYSPLSSIQAQHCLQGRLISTHVTLENFPLDERFKKLSTHEPGSLSVQANEIIERTHYPLDIQFLPAATGLKVQMAYSTDYQKDMYQFIQVHFCQVLTQLSHAPEQQLSTVSLIDADTQQKIIHQTQAGLKQFPFDSLLNRFNTAVKNTPTAIALVYQDTQLSYVQLNAYANDLANRLYTSDLVAGDYVGLCFERSAEVVIAIVAVLKLGMVYVSIDSSLPKQRMEFMAQDSAIKMLLTSPDKAAELAAVAPQLQAVTLSELSQANLAVQTGSWQAQANSPAYVIYTSGSTGQPKGVLVSHGNMARLFSVADSLFDFNEKDVWCLFHSYGFDFSVWEIWGALSYGAKLVVVPYWLSRSPEDFHQLLAKQKVTVLNQTPTAFKQLIDIDQHIDSKLDDLRYVIFGGENLEYKQLELWFKAYGDSPQLINMYGITETTVHVTFKKISPEQTGLKSSIIGKPLADLMVYILDQYGQLSAPGVPGELYVGGAGVCLGYLNRAELSAQRFVKLSQFQQQDDALFYRTGDSGRYLENGELEYLGRLDQQVQFHGFRIELGEIEQVMMQQSMIEQVVVMLIENQQDQQMLVAYYSTRSSEVLSTADLRAPLAKLLPAYMVPGFFVHLTQFPLTANGKVNRQALPAPKMDLDEQFLAANTPQQQLLVEAWQQILPIENIGIKDSFFSLGGDSIQAIRVVSQVRKQGYSIEVQDIFRYPTIQELAPWLQALGDAKKNQQLTGQVGLTPIQHWLFQQQDQYPQHFNHTALLEATDGRWQAAELEQVWNQLIQHHDALRSQFHIAEDNVQSVILPVKQVTISVQTVSLMTEQDVDGTMQKHAHQQQQGLVLDQPPLISLVLYQCPSGDRLLIIVHHLLIDGVSWRILLEDFSALYYALISQQQYTLPAQTDSYVEWSKGLYQYSQQVSLLAELPYWKAQLSRDSGHSWADKRCLYKDARTIQTHLTIEHSQQLLQQARVVFNSSVEELLLAALIPTLEAWAGLTETLLLLEGHGREPVLTDLDVSRTVGWFTSLYPFVLSKVKGRDLGYQIKTVKDSLRKVPHKGMGYGVLRYLTPAKFKAGDALSFNPGLVFNYLGCFDRSDEAGLYQALSHDVGDAVAGQNLRPCAIEFSAMVLADQMQIDWRYDQHCFTEDSVQHLATLYQANLNKVVEYCLLQNSQQITASDLSYNELSLDELDEIFPHQKTQLKDLYPLTPMQEGMLFHALQDTKSTAYHEQIRLTLQGDLEPANYGLAWQKLVLRHDILRTVFIVNKTQLALQAVLNNVPSVFVFEDWSTQASELQHQNLERYLQTDLADKFNLAEQPALRIKLIKFAAQSWHLVWSFHHILLDGWSVGVLMDEMAQIYQSIKQGCEPMLPASPPFSHYLKWLKQQDSSNGIQFWQNYLDDYNELASLPSCRGQVAQASEFKQDFPADLPAKLQQAAKHYKVTVNALIQAAWGILLARYNDRRDVVFASVVSGRSSAIANIDNMVGLLINAVPIRVGFSSTEAVADLLSRLHQHNSASQAYQFIAMADTQPQHGAPDHLLVFENFHQSPAGQSNQAELSIIDIHAREQTNYDLTLVVSPGQYWKLTCLYNTGRYADHYIEQVAAHFITLLSALSNPVDTATIDTLEMLTSKEKNQLMQDSLGACYDLPEQQSLAALFEQTAQQYGQQLALLDTQIQLSYQTLNAKVNRLAHRLLSRGLKQGDIVAIALARDSMRIISLLAVIKVGAAYLGVELDTPKQRVKHLCDDAGVRLLIKQTSTELEISDLDEFDPFYEIQQTASEDDLRLNIPDSAIAYISYTSGSTGVPKGVCVSHKNVMRLVLNNDFASITPADRFLQFAPLSFDASTFEIWGALLNGASLSVLDQPQPNLRQLGTAIKQQGVSILWLTAGLFHQMVDEQLEDLAQLRQLLAGGDVISAAHVAKLIKRYPAIGFVNGYGPTENTTFSCCQRVTANSALATGVAIGKAIGNSEAWVLDKQLRLQPLAAIGELYVAGAGVAYGYWQQTRQTAQAFIPHPYAKTAGQRLYRTGDIVSLNAQGSIDFIGRADQQFKIRGYRVEAQEVEAAIKQDDSVKDVLVDIVKDKTGDKALVAYVVIKPAAKFNSEAIASKMVSQLPAYLIPDFWLEINGFPLNKNGKVDKTLLPNPFKGQSLAELISPRNNTEQALLAIWQQVLGFESFGVMDDFFCLGGHSLKATQTVSLIRKQLDIEVPLTWIFEAPTIARLAKKIQDLANTDKAAPKLVKRDRSRRKVI